MQIVKNDLSYENRAELGSCFDAVIIGGGPAGASCALWLKLLGFNPCIIESRDCLGGLQNESPYPNNWIAVVNNVTGHNIAKQIHTNIMKNDIQCYLESRVINIHKLNKNTLYKVEFTDSSDDTNFVLSPFIVIATGVKPVTDGIRESERILIGPGDKISSINFDNKRVAILGGGDSAFENYIFIKKKHNCDVHIYARSHKSICARPSLRGQVLNSDVIIGKYKINSLNYSVNNNIYDYIIILYGWSPNTNFISNLELIHDKKGFLETSPLTAETSEPSIYAIGEVAKRFHPCCTTAMADGTIAAKSIESKLNTKFTININKSYRNPKYKKNLISKIY